MGGVHTALSNYLYARHQAGNMAGQANDLVNRAEIPQKAGSTIENSVRGAQSVLSGFFGKWKFLMPGKETTARS